MVAGFAGEAFITPMYNSVIVSGAGTDAVGSLSWACLEETGSRRDRRAVTVQVREPMVVA